MRSPAPQALPFLSKRTPSEKATPGDQFLWAAARLCFHTYVGFCLLSVIGGFLTAPLMTWYFFGDWRFWRHWKSGMGLYLHGVRMFTYILRDGNGGFMLDVPLTDPPASKVDLEKTEFSAQWEFGTTCGPCNRCCTKILCPVLDLETGLCEGHESFFWRYFNCGRYPTNQREIDFYICNKWVLKPEKRQIAKPLVTEQDHQVA